MPSTSTSRTVTGLTNGTSYLFRVAAVNHTVGDYSSTASATPSSTPASVTVSGGSGDFINGFVTYSGVSRNPYSLSGEENGRPRYVSAVQTYYGNFAKIFWTGSAWEIRVIDNAIVFASSSQDGAVPPTSGWTDTWGGNPTIAY